MWWVYFGGVGVCSAAFALCCVYNLGGFLGLWCFWVFLSFRETV